MSTREEFEKWAKENDVYPRNKNEIGFCSSMAASIAFAAWNAATLVEREACAKSCEQQVRHAGDPVTFYAALGQSAAAIRARGDA